MEGMVISFQAYRVYEFNCHTWLEALRRIYDIYIDIYKFTQCCCMLIQRAVFTHIFHVQYNVSFLVQGLTCLPALVM